MMAVSKNDADDRCRYEIKRLLPLAALLQLLLFPQAEAQPLLLQLDRSLYLPGDEGLLTLHFTNVGSETLLLIKASATFSLMTLRQELLVLSFTSSSGQLAVPPGAKASLKIPFSIPLEAAPGFTNVTVVVSYSLPDGSTLVEKGSTLLLVESPFRLVATQLERIQGLMDRLEVLQQENLRSEEEIRSLKAQLNSLKEELARIEREKAQLEASLQELREERDQLQLKASVFKFQRDELEEGIVAYSRAVMILLGLLLILGAFSFTTWRRYKGAMRSP